MGKLHGFQTQLFIDTRPKTKLNESSLMLYYKYRPAINKCMCFFRLTEFLSGWRVARNDWVTCPFSAVGMALLKVLGCLLGILVIGYIVVNQGSSQTLNIFFKVRIQIHK